jgi:hypothetical protein
MTSFMVFLNVCLINVHTWLQYSQDYHAIVRAKNSLVFMRKLLKKYFDKCKIAPPCKLHSYYNFGRKYL